MNNDNIMSLTDYLEPPFFAQQLYTNFLRDPSVKLDDKKIQFLEQIR